MISFSSITDRNKTNLDDVDEWYITNTVIRDPPKSYHTRRVIKVGDNNDLLDAEDSSVDRVSDSILQFSKGINPMVSIQYNNTNGTEAFLPYRIIRDGAFRPPLDFQYNQYPLSRLPRDVTSFQNFSHLVDYTKGKSVPLETTRFKEIQNSFVTPIFAPIQHCLGAKSEAMLRSEAFTTTVPYPKINNLKVESNKSLDTSGQIRSNMINKDMSSSLNVSASSIKLPTGFTGISKLQEAKVKPQEKVLTGGYSSNGSRSIVSIPYTPKIPVLPNKITTSYTAPKTARYEPSLKTGEAQLRATRGSYSFTGRTDGQRQIESRMS